MFQVNKSSSDFWNSLKSTWQQCADLPKFIDKHWATSMAELDGKVYASTQDKRGGFFEPLMYDSKMDKWSSLPKLPYCRFSLVTVPDKKQVLAIGGLVKDYNTGVVKITNKVFLWDEANRKWTTPYPNMPTA